MAENINLDFAAVDGQHVCSISMPAAALPAVREILENLEAVAHAINGHGRFVAAEAEAETTQENLRRRVRAGTAVVNSGPRIDRMIDISTAEGPTLAVDLTCGHRFIVTGNFHAFRHVMREGDCWPCKTCAAAQYAASNADMADPPRTNYGDYDGPLFLLPAVLCDELLEAAIELKAVRADPSADLNRMVAEATAAIRGEAAQIDEAEPEPCRTPVPLDDDLATAAELCGPRHVLAIERRKRRPFAGMFGCSETESVAEIVLQQLAEGGGWLAPVDLSSCEAWDLNHTHSGPDGTAVCDFAARYLDGRTVNGLFIFRALRLDDRPRCGVCGSRAGSVGACICPDYRHQRP